MCHEGFDASPAEQPRDSQGEEAGKCRCRRNVSHTSCSPLTPAKDSKKRNRSPHHLPDPLIVSCCVAATAFPFDLPMLLVTSIMAPPDFYCNPERFQDLMRASSKSQINQSINQSVNQSINQPINQSINQSNQSINQSIKSNQSNEIKSNQNQIKSINQIKSK